MVAVIDPATSFLDTLNRFFKRHAGSKWPGVLQQ